MRGRFSPPPEFALRRRGQPWRLTRELGTFPAMEIEHWRFARASPWLPSAHLRAPPWPTAAPAVEVNPKAARRGGSSTLAALRDGHQRQCDARHYLGCRRTSLQATFASGTAASGGRGRSDYRGPQTSSPWGAEATMCSMKCSNEQATMCSMKCSNEQTSANWS
jgi:hypothetical protein